MKSWIITTVIAFSLVLPATARVIHVSLDGQADFDTIQTGIDAAEEGDTIQVAPGEYVVTSPITFQGKPITVRAEAGPEVTTIRMSDPPGRRVSFPYNPDRFSVIIFESGETEASVLEGFTISNGTGCLWEYPPSPGPSYQVGAGIFCNGASPTITNCVISENHTETDRSIQDCGGGVALLNSSAVLQNCTISNNRTSYWAGGIYIFNGSPVLQDCIISDNEVTHAKGQGGGLILGSGNAVQSGTPWESFIAMVNTARTHGVYPLVG